MRGGGQPPQRPDPGRVSTGGIDAPVQNRSGIVSAKQLTDVGGLAQRGHRVTPIGGDESQVLAQHRPCLGAGQTRVELIGGEVQLRQQRRGRHVVGRPTQGVVIHRRGRTQPHERVTGLACGGGGRDLGIVAGQGFRQDVDGGFGVSCLGDNTRCGSDSAVDR